jgi:hypothetical protein
MRDFHIIASKTSSSDYPRVDVSKEYIFDMVELNTSNKVQD